MAGDPAPRRSPLAVHRRRSRGRAGGAAGAAAGRPAHAGAAPALPGRARPGMARRQTVDDVDLVAIIYRLDPQRWVVERVLTTPGPRPHGLAWEGRYLWHSDGDLNAFFKFDLDTGQIVETIQLADSDPLSHGLTIWEGTLWYCDDVGVVCRMRL